MSYCRFQNTADDLQDCYDNMDNDGLSFEEHTARWRLIRLCIKIAADYEDEGTQEAMPKRETTQIED
jgi:hypothetical protein